VPDMEVRNCPIGPRTTSMVFTWFPSSNHGPTCVGSANAPGTITLNHRFQSVCTGNNIGWISSGNPPYTHHSFGANEILIPRYNVYNVHITRHAGTFTCAT
jgi:hypothetical protein